MKRFDLYCTMIAVSVVLVISAVVIWVVRSRQIRNAQGPQVELRQQKPGDAGTKTLPGDKPHDQDPGIDPDKHPLDYTALRQGETPEALVEELANALNDLDMKKFSELTGGTIDAKSLEALRDFAEKQKAAGQLLKIREVGEIDLQQGSRWAIEGGVSGSLPRLYLDMRKGPDGWRVEEITLPGDPDAPADRDDALATAEVFLRAVLALDFEEARQYVDHGRVSDARIAGLCILFEEGEYQLRKQKPLRVLLKRDDFASYLANVVATDGEEAAQFGLNLARQGEPAKWVVSEINLDKLLADYAQRVAGGDVYYSPLVRNPGGGETLALYFGFDEDEVSPRTRRQLEIVAAILKADPVKKLTLSGHTDSKGTDDYNRQLSQRRAETVKEFLLTAGVQAQQIVTLAKGASEPRRPNVTESGADNPEGRRANRRTEIYLDF